MIQHFDSTIKAFIGKSIFRLIPTSDDSIVIDFSDGTWTTLYVEGDCCSTSIFYDIEFPDECIDSEILSMEQGVEGDTEEEALARNTAHKEFFTNYECLSIWNVVFKTKAGDIIIRHANSSNGYYDGMISFSEIQDSSSIGLN